MRAPIIRTSPCAVNPCSSLTLPVTCNRSAWMERSPPWITVSTHSSRPPISDSQSQIADSLEVLALVLSAPVTWLRDRSRSRRIRTPLASRPGTLSHPVSASSASWAPSTVTSEANEQPSNRSGNGTSRPARSRPPVTSAPLSRTPRGSIWPRSSRQQRRSRSAETRRRAPPFPHTRARPAVAAARSSASPTWSILRARLSAPLHRPGDCAPARARRLRWQPPRAAATHLEVTA